MRAIAMMRAASEELHCSRSQSPLPAKKQPQKTARWTTLSAAVLVQSVAGLSYIFSLYSSTLKAKFHLVPCYSEIWGFASFASLYSAGSLAEGAASYDLAMFRPRPHELVLEVLAGDRHGRIVGERLRDHLGVVKDPGRGTRPGRRAGVKSGATEHARDPRVILGGQPHCSCQSSVRLNCQVGVNIAFFALLS